MIWPPSKAISTRTRSVSATGHHLREDAVHRIRMDERDLEAEQPLARALVDQLGARVCQLGQCLAHVADLVGDVVHPGASLREEPSHRGVVAQRLEQLDPPFPELQRRCPHALAGDRRPVLDLGAEEVLVRLERCVEVLDCDAHVMDSPRPHGAMLPSGRLQSAGNAMTRGTPTVADALDSGWTSARRSRTSSRTIVSFSSNAWVSRSSGA